MKIVNAMPGATATANLCRLAIGLSTLIWLAAGDWLSAAVGSTALLLTAAPGALLRHSELREPSTVAAALLLAAHIVLGMQMNLYETSKLYDKAMHVIGSGAIAALLLVATREFCVRERIAVPRVLVAVIVFAGTLSAGTLWEVFEFAIDRTGLFFAQRGLIDTMIDLVADALGALLALSIFAGMSYAQTNTSL